MNGDTDTIAAALEGAPEHVSHAAVRAHLLRFPSRIVGLPGDNVPALQGKARDQVAGEPIPKEHDLLIGA